MFDINIFDFVRRNITSALRFPVIMAFVRSLLAALKPIDTWLADVRADIAEQYRWNGTIHSIEKLLNDRYDPIHRRIYLKLEVKKPIWFWKDEFEQPDWFWKDEGDLMDWDWLDEETFNEQTAVPYEFKVYVHATISFVPAELAALVDLYRWAGYRFIIVTYGIGGETEIPIDHYE